MFGSSRADQNPRLNQPLTAGFLCPKFVKGKTADKLHHWTVVKLPRPGIIGEEGYKAFMDSVLQETWELADDWFSKKRLCRMRRWSPGHEHLWSLAHPLDLEYV